MSWSPTVYAQLPDAKAVLALAGALGIEVMPDGSLSTGNQHFALVRIDPPWQTPPVLDADGNIVTPGVRETGIWFMGRLNDDWSGYAATMAALQAAGVLREPANPGNVFA